MLLPKEQKGCRRKCKGTGDLFFIDKMKNTGGAHEKEVARINYKKAYNMEEEWIYSEEYSRVIRSRLCFIRNF